MELRNNSLKTIHLYLISRIDEVGTDLKKEVVGAHLQLIPQDTKQSLQIEIALILSQVTKET